MIDLLLLAGVALCVISIVMAVVSVLRTQVPRGAALALILGIAVLFAAAWAGERALGVASVTDAWNRVISGEAFGTNTVTAPPPAVIETMPEAQPVTSPDTTQPAAQAPLQDNAAGENPVPEAPEAPAEGSIQPAQ